MRGQMETEGLHSDACHITVIPLADQRQQHELQSLLDCMAIREQVFIVEQHVPMAIEQDGRDNESGHVLLWAQGNPVGTLRFRPTEEGVKMERIAILKEFRGRHLGRLLIREGLRAIRMSGLTERVYIHAQEHAASFYASMGFVPTGEHTVEANIPHETMQIDTDTEERLLDMDPCQPL
ncbi:MAG: GNAT family N-acetyltransferase [Sphaerochaetaceae bacterium]|nr:GNAT family N-acetyltransferase [Sphaerochaetaceae bacterium]MDD3942139.1 GNAT family N-acetyltransferase [Sphaerochaetaceae bacterium]MDX9939122.1 GNAT family N-acetyltransferase [Sphaerochaetaceae bacterium]